MGLQELTGTYVSLRGHGGAELETVPRLNRTDLLFPSTVSDERPISGWSKYEKRLGDGVPAWRLHDLRRTFGTSLAEMEVEPHIVERLLNHSMGAPSAIKPIAS